MLIKIVSLMFDSAYGGFKDDDLREFLKDKELISSTDHFFIRNDVPYITFILKYFPHRAEVEAAKTSTKEKPSEAWRESLSEHEMGLFNLLRDWRSQRCKKEGVPPYVVFVKWMDFVKWLLVTTDGFPKTARFTFSDRLTRLALDVVEDLIEARYSRNKSLVTSLRRLQPSRTFMRPPKMPCAENAARSRLPLFIFIWKMRSSLFGHN